MNLEYSTITFTRGNKNLIPTFLSILYQDVKPKEVVLIIDSRWNELYNIKEQIIKLDFIFSMNNIKFIYQYSYEDSFAKMKNFGYSHIITPLVLYVEDDSYIPPNYSVHLLHGINEKTGAIGGCQILLNNFEDIEEQPIFEKIELPKENLYQTLKIVDSKLEYNSIKHQVYWYKGDEDILFREINCHALLHTYMLNMRVLNNIIGGWDELAPENGSLIFEEMDVMLGMFCKGYDVKLLPDIRMFHLRKDNKREVKSDLFNFEARNKKREERKLYFGNKYKDLLK